MVLSPISLGQFHDRTHEPVTLGTDSGHYWGRRRGKAKALFRCFVIRRSRFAPGDSFLTTAQPQAWGLLC